MMESMPKTSVVIEEATPTRIDTGSADSRSGLSQKSAPPTSREVSGVDCSPPSSSSASSSTPPELKRPDGCIVCDSTEYLRHVDKDILLNYGVRICVVCKAKDPSRWSQIVKTNAKKLYLVSDGVLDRLPFVKRPNPRNPNFKPMMMYLRYQVEQEAIEIYGSAEELEEERVQRARKRALRTMKGTSSKSKRRRKTLVKPKPQDSSAILQKSDRFLLLPTGHFAGGGLKQSITNGKLSRDRSRGSSSITSKTHVHVFGPLTYENNSDMAVKKCVSCGFTRKFEVL